MKSIPLWLIIALAIPRLVRILYPSVWVEDDVFLESAFAASKGLRAYLDFAHPQMPLLEWVAGVYIQLVGASHVKMEVLNGAAIYATSVLIYLLGRRVFDARAGIAASLLYACHSLVFRYHVWAREFFLNALVLGAILVLLGDPTRSRRRFLLASALLCAACAIKLTAGLAVAAICVYMAVGMRAPARAAVFALTIAAGFGAFVAFCVWRYGEAFVSQAVLFHFLKGVDAKGAGPAYILSLLDVLGPLSLLGLWHVLRHVRWNDALGLAAVVFVADLVFFGVVSPTAWGHNYLEPWPFVALLAGAGLVSLVDARRTSWLAAGVRAALVAICLIWVTPLDNESALRGSVYGFGFVPRGELSSLASALRDGTGSADEVIAPSFIAFEANRLQAIRYPENIGVMTAGDDLRRTAGFWQARQHFGTRSFYDLINDTSAIWNREVVRAIAPGGRVHAMIPDSAIQLLPLVNASPAALADRGFHVALQTEHFTLWLRRSDRTSLDQRTTNVSAGGV